MVQISLSHCIYCQISLYLATKDLIIQMVHPSGNIYDLNPHISNYWIIKKSYKKKNKYWLLWLWHPFIKKITWNDWILGNAKVNNGSRNLIFFYVKAIGFLFFILFFYPNFQVFVFLEPRFESNRMLFKGQIFLSTQKRNTNDLTFQKKKKPMKCI